MCKVKELITYCDYFQIMLISLFMLYMNYVFAIWNYEFVVEGRNLKICVALAKNWKGVQLLN